MHSTEDPEKPLGGIRVMDFTHVLAGPYCTQLLADAGADVIKVEMQTGDMARFMPPVRRMPDGTMLSGCLMGVNRGKRSVAVDMRSPDDRDLVLRLIDTADIVIESFTPGAMRKLGVDLGEVRARRPSPITLSISLYGDEENVGDFASRKGLAIIAEAESGVAWMNRDDEGRPQYQKIPFADMGSGLAAYGALVTALYNRRASGTGRHIEISMVKTMLSMSTVAMVGAQIFDAQNPRPTPAAYGVFRSKDGDIALAALQDSHFSALAQAMGQPGLASDERYRHGGARNQRVEEVNAMIGAWTATQYSADLVDQLSAAGIPIGVVQSLAQIADEKDLMPKGFLKSVADGYGDVAQVPDNPLGYSTNVDFPALDRDGEAIRALVAQGASSWRMN